MKTIDQVTNRKAKDSVFIDLFAQPENQLRMLHVFHPEMTDVTAEDIKTVTLKQVITNHQYNDLAFVVRDLMIVFVEAQSTWSDNIVLVGQYIIFCHVFDQQVRKHGRTEAAALETIRICKDRGVLREYLENREKEVVNIMIMLFDQQYATEAYARNEAVKAEKKASFPLLFLL